MTHSRPPSQPTEFEGTLYNDDRLVRCSRLPERILARLSRARSMRGEREDGLARGGGLRLFDWPERSRRLRARRQHRTGGGRTKAER